MTSIPKTSTFQHCTYYAGVYALLLGSVEFLRSLFFFSCRRRHTRSLCDWSSDVCSSDLESDRINRMNRIPFGSESERVPRPFTDRKSTRLNSSHTVISYAVFCLKKKK